MNYTSEQHRRIVIQGFSGAFHEIAAKHFYANEQLQTLPASTFGELVEMAEDSNTADGAIMAIENSIAGSILGNYQLINTSSLKIKGEMYLRIKQNLMALPGQQITDLEEVRSHPMAIAQCRAFFKAYPDIRLVETVDTALSAKEIRNGQLKRVGAIASTLAAELYEMDILANSIETNKVNFTRFLILEKEALDQIKEQAQKISICFSLEHKVGTLHKVLEALSRREASLTKIQSVPLIGSQWQYMFFVDFVLQKATDYEATIKALLPLTNNMNVLGKYKIGQYHDY